MCVALKPEVAIATAAEVVTIKKVNPFKIECFRLREFRELRDGNKI